MAYYYLEPEVSGELGEHSILDTSIRPPHVTHLHFVFFGWLGDDLIECFPVYLISERLKNKLQESDLIGYTIDECEIEVIEEFKLMQPNVSLPDFYWFKIIGKEGDDFTISKNKLKVSEKAYSLLMLFNLQYADIEKSI